VTDLLAEIMKAEPDWTKLPADVPGRVRILIWRCLQKDAKRRLRDIGEARFELSETGSDVSGALTGAVAGAVGSLGATTEPKGMSGGRLAAAIGLAVLVGTAASAYIFPRAARFYSQRGGTKPSPACRLAGLVRAPTNHGEYAMARSPQGDIGCRKRLVGPG